MSDEALMERALALAMRGWGRVSPNPMVGAVVVADGRVVGEGAHEGPGLPHAEVVALREAGERARGASLFTTLEPCSHQGRTPPCVDAVIAAGIARVVAATTDPNPIVDGRGIARLREAGIEVMTGVHAAEAARINAAFAKHIRTGIPFVIWKTASSLDGKVASRDGTSRWITGEAARRDVHRLRAWSDAILVGAGTVVADDPSLTVRDPEYVGRPPFRVLADAAGRVPPSGDLFDDEAPTIVATTERAGRDRREAWRAAGAEVLVYAPGSDGMVPVGELLGDLGKRDVQGVLLEGGPTLAWSAVEEGTVDRVVAYLAPALIGGAEAPSALGGRGFAPVGRALRLDLVEAETVGGDLRVEADVHRDR